MSSLQDGIYLDPGPPPASFYLLVMDAVAGATGTEVRNAIATVWKMLGDLRRGVVRDLADTRAGETAVTIEAETFDALLGYGASFFDAGRRLTTAARPALLTPLGHDDGPFRSLSWAPRTPPGSGEGDFCIQLTGDREHAAARPAVEIWKLIADEGLPLVLRESHAGFARDDRRSWIGFHDGVSNIRHSQRQAAVECPGDPSWNRGGTFLAFLRCEVDLAAWRRLSREEQEILVGRDKLSGNALRAVERVDGRLVPRAFSATGEDGDAFKDPPETGDRLVEASHVHRANQNRAEPTTAAGHRIFRQGYEYLDGFADGEPSLGLNFVSFQSDIFHLRQVLGLLGWLGGANFGGPEPGTTHDGPPAIELLSLRAGGLYAVPPREGTFPGDALFE